MSLKGRVVPEPVDVGQMAPPIYARLPDVAGLFAARAARLDTLAPGNPLEPFLRFVAAVARAQHAAAGRLPAGTLPGADHIAFCKAHEFAPLDRLTWKRDPSFLAAARAVARELDGVDMPAPARAALDAFAARDDASVEALADRALRGACERWEHAETPFVGAALELHWTRMAALLDLADVAPLAARNLCPVCGSHPVASVIETAQGRQGSRFLCCPLCQTRWNYTRVQCAHCEGSKGVAYQSLEGAARAVRAETCDECRSYTKILYHEEDPALDPVADDLATVTLDILVSEGGWARACASPYLSPDPDEADAEPLSPASP
ncbi:MAG: formate dehydrogenase accessory protein FdhE [Rhodospirillales bacterium]|nr:formate dehydrogenase accessory protein FdhE [Rhodospirillales bacterium]QQS10685.1 MAG: formate dehydrogenase accessory protein FdhE [Rhodospirillales bacterium]